MNNITLQISLAPSDFKHVLHLLPHQLKVFENQVDEILLTYDTHKSKGRFAINWEQNNAKMWAFLQEYAKQHPKISLLKIDYSAAKNQDIAQKYFKRKSIPAKDWRGGPFYTYFYGIHEAKNNFVFHIDSDLFFGGLSQTWLQEAINLYKADSQILFINPLPGPPKNDGTLIGQNYFNYKNKPFYFGFNGMSTRLFLVDKNRLALNFIKNLVTTKVRELIRALYKKNPPFKLPEEIFGKYMAKHQYIRVDFKGNKPGLWSLHPPYRTQQFYDDLPLIIKKIEENDVPETQKGFYDIVDELVDWTEVKSKLIKK